MTASCSEAQTNVTHRSPRAEERGNSALIVSTDARVISRVSQSLIAMGVTVVHHAHDAKSLGMVMATEPAGRLALVDLAAIGPNGVNLVWHLRGACWHRVLAVVSRHDQTACIQAIASGVDGVLMRNNVMKVHGDWTIGASSEELRAHRLTSREVEVMCLVASGSTNNEVAEALGLSALTVKSHLARIGQKLGMGDRAGMVLQLMRRGVIL